MTQWTPSAFAIPVASTCTMLGVQNTTAIKMASTMNCANQVISRKVDEQSHNAYYSQE